MSLLEILVRGTIIYLALCLLLRVVLKRQAGKVSLSDLLVVSIIAGVCRNPLVKDAYSITDGVLVTATVLGWSFAVDWLCYYVPLIHKFLHSPPLPLIQQCQVLRENLQHELMTESTLKSKLRRAGVREPAEVAEAWMEGDGHVSVIKKRDLLEESAQQESDKPTPGADNHGPQPQANRGPERNGVPAETSSPTDAEVRAFLEAARKLEDKVARHQQAIAAHQQEMADVQAALSRFGFRMKLPAHGRTGKAKTLHEQERP
jgi:uncharacterized membrane protein YcaP (DUF421 family)